MIPGIRKSEKGVLFSIANGNPPNNVPEGERIKVPPPTIAPSLTWLISQYECFVKGLFSWFNEHFDNEQKNNYDDKGDINLFVILC